MSEDLANEFAQAYSKEDYETMSSILRTVRYECKMVVMIHLIIIVVRRNPKAIGTLPLTSLISLLEGCPSEELFEEITAVLGLVIDATDAASLASSFGVSPEAAIVCFTL